MNATTDKPVTMQDLVDIAFSAVPEAEEFGRNRETWRRVSEEDRCTAVLAGRVLAKDKAALIDELKGAGADAIEAWLAMTDAFDNAADRYTAGRCVRVCARAMHGGACIDDSA